MLFRSILEDRDFVRTLGPERLVPPLRQRTRRPSLEVAHKRLPVVHAELLLLRFGERDQALVVVPSPLDLCGAEVCTAASRVLQLLPRREGRGWFRRVLVERERFIGLALRA